MDTLTCASESALSVTPYRFSLLKRKPAPSESSLTETDSTLPDRNSSLWALDHPFSDDKTNTCWRSLIDDPESVPEAQPAPVYSSRPRAHTVHDRPFSRVIRVPPPFFDDTLLDLEEKSVRASMSNPEIVMLKKDDAPPDEPLSPNPLSRHVGSVVVPPLKPTKKGAGVKGSKRRRSVSIAAISSPLPIASTTSGPPVPPMVLTNTSTFTLSAFPPPPQTIPSIHPVSLDDVPSAAIPDIDTSLRPIPPTPAQSYLLEVDQPSHVASASPVSPAVKPSPIVLQKGALNKAYFDFGEPPDYSEFSETRLPSDDQLQQAAFLPVISESGVRISFGRLFREQKTIVCFIRHFWCPLCQDYMFSISRNVSPKVLDDAGVDLVIVSNGSFEMIKAYRKIFKTPFEVYTDPTHEVYNALGMTLQTMEKGPKGNYIRHGLLGGIGMVVANAVKSGMPVWKAGGEISQLGGEFVLGPGITCSWAHRMRYTRDHIPILQVIAEAGVDMYTPLHRIESSTGGSFLGLSAREESKWMERRRKLLRNLKKDKMARRGGPQYIDTASTTTGTCSNRSSVVPTLTECSWTPATEHGINVGLSQYDIQIIREVEEEDVASEQGPSSGLKLSPPTEEVSYGAETYTNSFVEDASVLDQVDAESSVTDLASITDAVHVSFEQARIAASPCRSSKLDQTGMSSHRSSASSIGSGFDVVASHHDVYFTKTPANFLSPSYSESSLESF
ncbi:unnamed protein product [Mycena citricolor]|uniref:AhpC/TSA antioxidant enzyme-domain-containing protein n=1 Tax=Mycena citricolor TaxID=2018698 RepID=A0AAD2H085_9AGAR|nr:unnamed protein product [Mycena citricolor]